MAAHPTRHGFTRKILHLKIAGTSGNQSESSDIQRQPAPPGRQVRQEGLSDDALR